MTFALSSGAEMPSAQALDAPASPITGTNRQLLLVRSSTWFAATGTLERYDRGADGRWVLAAPAIPVNLGRGGMGWGRGLHAQPKTGLFKKEGDGRSPAGVFALGRAFGTAEALPSGAHDFPYRQSLSSTYCVEDVRSKFYNQIIDSSGVTRTSWERWSELKRSDGLFDWGVIVRQNEPEVRRGAGSCVFLHVWRGPRIPTSGCTAMPREDLEATLRWLDPRREPVLVQLPEPAFQAERSSWGLP
jgi:L,D-peptidoglycan transpeptidase YkuD (ErfK/YbiS/YcfS/YnhG family)